MGLTMLRRLSENPAAAGLRPAANSEGLRRQVQNVLNVGYFYASGRFGLASLTSKFSLGLATNPILGQPPRAAHDNWSYLPGN